VVLDVPLQRRVTVAGKVAREGGEPTITATGVRY
jgi:hypothetical protein